MEDDSQHIIDSLVEGRVPFSITFDKNHFVVLITDSLNNAQLTTAVQLGGVLEKDGKVYILGGL